MVQGLSLAIEQEKIKLLPDKIARHELVSYEAEVLPSGYTRYGAPEGGWDDTVIARCLMWHKARHRTPYPTTSDEKIELSLPEGWRAHNAPPNPGTWQHDGWAMAREARRTEVEQAFKKANAGMDDPWEPVGGLKGLADWSGF